MSEKPQKIFVSIIQDELNACEDRIWVLDQESMQSAWADGPLVLRAWTVYAFISDKSVVKRIERTLEMVRRFFAEKAKEEKVAYPRRDVHNLCQMILSAWYPDLEELVNQATRGAELKAKLLLTKHIGERWQERSS